MRRWVGLLLGLGLVLAQPTPAERAEGLRARLVEAQLELAFDPQAAAGLLQAAQAEAAALAKAGLTVDLKPLEEALGARDEAAFARARARLWTDLLRQGYLRLEEAVRSGDLAAAQGWALLREYRPATRYAAPEAEATLALEELRQGRLKPEEALLAVRADLLGAYQARLEAALRDLEEAQSQGQPVRAAEQRALAQGYFEILAPAYREARGAARLAEARQALASGPLGAIREALSGFQAAPLSPRERARRANQTLRFLDLVAVEYGRGVVGPAGAVRVTKSLEIEEATAFLESARAAWSALEPMFPAAKVEGVRQGFKGLEQGLQAARQGDNPPSAQALEEGVRALRQELEALLPAEWRRADPAGDLEVIRQQLKALENAVAQGRYDLAETARMDAYALLESGPEARLRVFAPALALEIEDLFWNGPDGLARLIRQKAPPSEVRETRRRLEAKLHEASGFLSTQSAPAATLANAAVIVFREGLEAVLILAALLGSLKRPEVRRFRRPLWQGALLAFGVTVLTWFAMRGLLTQFARYGERLEAVVSLLAIAVLLLIMNWFFHQVYWTDHLAGFHQQKQRLLRAETGQYLGLLSLGFVSVYREGFETVLFLQSLVLQSSLAPVLLGIGLGLLATVGVGLGVFALQAKLPYKRMLIATGVLLLLVLFTMVGTTAHVWQVVGWLPVHPIGGLALPYWAGMWLGLYPTWEGLGLQVFAVVAVLGSYFLAEGLKRRSLPGNVRHT
ncbi:MAG: FTR1 family protein [Meiothermus sp.]|nr:FTR1 family protein [Meiothermus sp.]